jgi:nicotinamidase/pyrazinamidase
MPEARPHYDSATALLVVDVQNDFADPAGSLAVTDGAAVIPVLAAEIDAALSAGALVAYSQDWHPEVTPHFAKDGGVWPAHCVMQTWGAELHPDLPIAGHVVRKGSNGEDGYSAFSMRDPLTGETIETELNALLRRRGVTRVVVGGLATDYCVVETGRDALRLGYETILLLDGIRPVDLQPGDGDRAIERMRAAGAIVVARLAGMSGAGSSDAGDGGAAPAPAAAPTPAATPDEGGPA